MRDLSNDLLQNFATDIHIIRFPELCWRPGFLPMAPLRKGVRPIWEAQATSVSSSRPRCCKSVRDATGHPCVPAKQQVLTYD